MAVQCPKCGVKHDVAEFYRQQVIRCQCGSVLNISMLETADDFLRYFDGEDEKTKANKIQAEAQQICKMILSEHCSRVDIEIAIGNLRDQVRNHFPDKMQTYQMIYEARFKRLWSQFRQDEAELDE